MFPQICGYKGFVAMKASEPLRGCGPSQEIETIASEIVTLYWFQTLMSDIRGVMEAPVQTTPPFVTEAI